MRTALVTGASQGIGRAVALRLAGDGFAVAVHYHTHGEEALATCREIQANGGQAVCVQADVSDRAQVREMFAAIRRELGGVDVLVNNAGIAQIKLFQDIAEQDWDRMFDVDVKGMFHCCQEALSDMLHRKRGKIINLSSIWGLTGASCEVHYSAAKAAVIGLTRALAKELGPSGIQVNCIAPGVIDTPMNGSLDSETLRQLCDETPLGRIGTPQDVAEAIAFFASDSSDFITGQVLSPNGGMVI